MVRWCGSEPRSLSFSTLFQPAGDSGGAQTTGAPLCHGDHPDLRHPQAVGQILWCVTHALWIGSSFTLVTCIGLIGHHLFAVWHGDRRLRARFGDAFEELKAKTSVVPFLAVIDGRQQLAWREFLRPAQLGIVIAVGIFWWAHRFIGTAGAMVRNSALESLLG